MHKAKPATLACCNSHIASLLIISRMASGLGQYTKFIPSKI